METLLIQIQNEVIRILKELDPDVDVFFDEIKGTDEEHGITMPETYYFVEIIPNRNDTVDQFFTDMGVLVDVAYHEKNESNTTYLVKAAELDGMFRPVFSFGDRHITIPNISHKVVDHVLHSSFSITFRYAGQEPAESESMNGLEVAIKKGV